MPFPPPSSGGINQLTGDVTAGPGSGSQAATLATVATAGTYGDSTHYPVVTIDAKGRVTTATTDVLPTASNGIGTLTGDVTAGPATAPDQSQASTLVATVNVNDVVGGLPTVATNVVRRSATATASQGECTVFTGSTSGQTITLPVTTGGYTNLVYRIVNDATVSVNVLGGTNSLAILGTIYSAATPYTLPAGYALDFVWDGTGVWQCLAQTQNAGASLTSASSFISANISTSAGVPVNVTSLSLAAGTWLIHGQVTATGSAATPLDVCIGPTSASSTGAYSSANSLLDSSTSDGTANVTAIVTLASTTTVYLNAQSGTTVTGGIKFETQNLFPNATGMTAVKIA